MSRAFALGFAASAAIHAVVLAALWPGPPGGRWMDPGAEPGFALLWAEGLGSASDAPSPAAPGDGGAKQQGDEPAQAEREGQASADRAVESTPAALPLPPVPPSLPAAARRAGVSAPPRPAAPPGAALEGDGPQPRGAAIAESGVLHPATIAAKLDPAYPWEARRNRWQGTVLLAVTVSAEGRPVAIEVARSSGHAALDDAAAEAVRQWRFVPARRDGMAVEDRVAVPITFRLRD